MTAGNRARTILVVFAVPLALAVLTALGLVSGLLGDGAWDALSWLALGAIPAVTAWYAARSIRWS
jgi:hypothetical protein